VTNGGAQISVNSNVLFYAASLIISHGSNKVIGLIYELCSPRNNSTKASVVLSADRASRSVQKDFSPKIGTGKYQLWK